VQFLQIQELGLLITPSLKGQLRREKIYNGPFEAFQEISGTGTFIRTKIEVLNSSKPLVTVALSEAILQKHLPQQKKVTHYI